MALTHILIDGYNLLHASAGTDHDWMPLPLEDARSAMVDFLATRRWGRRERITVVFDGSGTSALDMRAENQRGIEVLFSEAGVTADEVIQQIVRDAPNPRKILVVSADREIRDFVIRHGAKVIAPSSFLSTSEEHHQQRRRHTGEPPEKYRGAGPGEVEHWRRIFGFDDEDAE